MHGFKERGRGHLLYGKTNTSLIILLQKPHPGNPSLLLRIAALSNDAQIDTAAHPPFLSSSLPICVEDPSIPHCFYMVLLDVPPSLGESGINEIDLSFLVIHPPLFSPCMS